MDLTKVEGLWGIVVLAITKMENGDTLTQMELNACKEFAIAIGKVRNFITDNLLKQTFGRTYRLEDGNYIPDPEGEYISTQGLRGETIYVDKKFTLEGDDKHIAPLEQEER